jgi:hypothetical protein
MFFAKMVSKTHYRLIMKYSFKSNMQMIYQISVRGIVNFRNGKKIISELSQKVEANFIQEVIY